MSTSEFYFRTYCNKFHQVPTTESTNYKGGPQIQKEDLLFPNTIQYNTLHNTIHLFNQTFLTIQL